MRILIVEDALHVANLLAESVRLQGHEAIVAGTASSRQIDEARRLGVTEVIEKPFALNQLDEALGKLQPEGP